MPYIKSDRKTVTKPFTVEYAKNAGELNFQITTLISEYLKYNGKQYQQLNDVLGALEGAKLEFNRRIVAPYENSKIAENGDVYE